MKNLNLNIAHLIRQSDVARVTRAAAATATVTIAPLPLLLLLVNSGAFVYTYNHIYDRLSHISYLVIRKSIKSSIYNLLRVLVVSC